MLHLDAAPRPSAAPACPPDLPLLAHWKECPPSIGSSKRCTHVPGGPLRQPLLCSKSMLSVLPSPDELDRSCINLLGSGRPPLPPTTCNSSSPAAAPSLSSSVHLTWSSPRITSRSPGLHEPTTNPAVVATVTTVDTVRPCRENVVSRPMNGPDRPNMTGSGGTGNTEGRNWLTDVAAANNSSNAGSSSSSTNPSSLLPTMGSLFRPPLSLASASVEYSSVSVSSRGLYPQYPLHSSYYGNQSQPSASPSHLSSLGHYSFYPLQYPPPGYVANPSVLSRPFHPTPIDSYPTVLSSMGGHPRSAFLQQYSLSPPSTPSTPIRSQTLHIQQQPQQQQPQPQQHHHLHHHQQQQPHQLQQQHPQHFPTSPVDSSSSAKPRSPKEGERACVRSRLPPSSPTRHPSGSISTGVARTASHSLSDRSPSPSSKTESREQSTYRLPSGKEGSLKHRILIRPPDIRIEPSNEPSPPPVLTEPVGIRSVPVEEEHPSPKRCKPSAASMPTTPLRPNAPAWRTPSPNASTPTVPTQLRYPEHFMKGSIIQLASGELKSVEQLRTEDFVQSAELSGDLRIDSSTVVRIEENGEAGTSMLSFSVGEQRVQVTVEATLEHPFFVFGQGWSSCLPEKTLQRYNLPCQKLQVGDVCISLTHKDVPRSNVGSAGTSLCTENRTGSLSSVLMQTSVDSDATSCAPSVPQTHNIETQTTAGNFTTLPTTNIGMTQIPRVENQLPLQRKRRWSAPDKLNEETSNRKLS